jgi:hypothetical protein
LNRDQGAHLMVQAAGCGDITAKGYCKRILKSLNTQVCKDLLDKNPIDDWTWEAAVAGHEVAWLEFHENWNYEDKAVRALREKLDRESIHGTFPINLDGFKDSTQGSTKALATSALHWAARHGSVNHIEFPVTRRGTSVDERISDSTKGTPLMAAFEAGNLACARKLLELGALLDENNIFQENALHHLWHFSDKNAESLLGLILDAKSPQLKRAFENAFFSEAVREHRLGQKVTINLKMVPAESDPYPILCGFPIERIAGRGRKNLVRRLLQSWPAHFPNISHQSNGNPTRRMILWVSRLNFYEIRDMLVHFARHPYGQAQFNEQLPDIEDTTWTWGREKLDYMSRIALGWTGWRGVWRKPERFWRLCVHGATWKPAMISTIESALRP